MQPLSAHTNSLDARTAALVALLSIGAFSSARAVSSGAPPSVRVEPSAGEQPLEAGTPAPFLFLPTEPSHMGAAEKSAVLAHLPDPDSVKTAAAAKDQVPEPGTIGFGLAVLAIGLGKLAQSFARCWRTTSANPR